MKHILIGGAWPYANGPLHIGHIAALLPGDVLARYYRAKGSSVFYVSGTDCHGTPITIRAQQENTTPKKISDYYHEQFCRTFSALGFSYDLYTKTSDEYHIQFVQRFHKKLYKSPYIGSKMIRQAYCPTCRKVLVDRLVYGICPKCGANTRAEQCDVCGELLDPEIIEQPVCAQCGTAVEFQKDQELFLLLSELRQALQTYLDKHPTWRRNAVAFTKRYIDEGLRDRAITRNLDWGISVPDETFKDKKIYIWAENVLGYLSAAEYLCSQRGVDFTEIFGRNARHYYVHGKDNIPFHTIILPALLLAHGDGLRLPDEIISSEYMTLEGQKISTSKNWAIWADDLIHAYDADMIRYFFLANGPEKRDADFTYKEFVQRINTDLVGIWGNFVNRTLAFAVKYLDGKIPIGSPDPQIESDVKNAFSQVGTAIERGNFKEAIESIFALIRQGNRYYDTQKPWITRKENISQCHDCIYNCVYLISNLSVLLAPFLPFSSEKLSNWLGVNSDWNIKSIQAERHLTDIDILFKRLEKAE